MDIDALMSSGLVKDNPFMSSLASVFQKLSKDEFINIHQQYVQSTNERERQVEELKEENQRMKDVLSFNGMIHPSSTDTDPSRPTRAHLRLRPRSTCCPSGMPFAGCSVPSVTDPVQMLQSAGISLSEAYDTLASIDSNSPLMANPFVKDLVSSFQKLSKEEFINTVQKCESGNISDILMSSLVNGGVDVDIPIRQVESNVCGSMPELCSLEQARARAISDSSRVANIIMSMIESTLDRSDRIQNPKIRMVSILDKFAITLDVLCGVVPTVRENLDEETLARMETVKARLSNVVTEMMNVFLEQ